MTVDVKNLSREKEFLLSLSRVSPEALALEKAQTLINPTLNWAPTITYKNLFKLGKLNL